ncbi:N-acetyl-gamma-glutamyl-phosphate reductase [Vallitalea sp.]|jgi:N-acetyl-gamma-glutamyl-phosphate reductase|uniref:N-acetyl-gamma-glutamyl-phosphate reductase n=1 Tax=Vallitalea sp. TaxID=1882829 RepID=UPI0025CF7FAA|nr:N-acetyl-gamma-glutamyl-phosphate reductase [Vallitalea sp.]MCT4687182.1 N-acetyl-gamma-glutamyl-phosphate reductase [Vallitalea sp.]
MIKAGIIGATGYAGQELMRLLMQHPDCEVEVISSRTYKNTNYDQVYGNFMGIASDKLVDEEIDEISKKVDVLFIALPHGIASNKISSKTLENTKVIDLGADYRLNNLSVYEKWYGVSHGSPELIDEAVYGLCELKREDVKKSNLIANPGCYTTCSILSLMPLVKNNLIDKSSIIVDAKSGVTGAGRALNLGTHYTECNESIKAYKIASHRHTPEIEQELSGVTDSNISISFTPHLIPMNRGILITSYASLNNKYAYKDIKEVYEECYKDEQFIRLLPEGVFPETKWVKGSNYCDINFQIDDRTNRIIVLGTIDNLIKGAAGQAVQNMNIIFGLKESTGLEMIPGFPI